MPLVVFSGGARGKWLVLRLTVGDLKSGVETLSSLMVTAQEGRVRGERHK